MQFKRTTASSTMFFKQEQKASKINTPLGERMTFLRQELATRLENKDATARDISTIMILGTRLGHALHDYKSAIHQAHNAVNQLQHAPEQATEALAKVSMARTYETVVTSLDKAMYRAIKNKCFTATVTLSPITL